MERRLSEAGGAAGSRKEFLGLFLAALRRGSGAGGLRALRPSRAVKFAADVSLAVTAAGMTWSRSVISQSRKLCPAFVDFVRRCKTKSGGRDGRCAPKSNLLRMRSNSQSLGRKSSKSRSVRRLNASCRRTLRAVARSEEKKRRASKPEVSHVRARVEVLKSLVPGGAKMDTPQLLEEALHYIEALHTQVESMRTLLLYFEDGGGIHPTNL